MVHTEARFLESIVGTGTEAVGAVASEACPSNGRLLLRVLEGAFPFVNDAVDGGEWAGEDGPVMLNRVNVLREQMNSADGKKRKKGDGKKKARKAAASRL